MDENELYVKRDVKRALNDIKLLVAYIQGEQFERNQKINCTPIWEDVEIDKGNYPICDYTEYRVKESK